MIRFLTLFTFISFYYQLFADSIPLYDLNIKLKSSQIDSFYLNASKGDIIKLDIQTNRKNLITEVIFSEFDNYPIFKSRIDSKMKKLEFKIQNDGIYCIKTIAKKQLIFSSFMNIKIFVTNSKKHNPYVYWKTVRDTIKFEQTIIKRDTTYETIIDEKLTIHSELNPEENNQIIKKIVLPKNTMKCSIILSVGQEGQNEVNKNLKQIATGLTTGINPLIALFAPSFIDAISSGSETVKYKLFDSLNYALYKYNKKFETILNGEASSFIRTINTANNLVFYLKIMNNSLLYAKNITLKVNTMVINETTSIIAYRSPKVIIKKIPYTKEE